MSLQTFLVARNEVDPFLTPRAPWDFAPERESLANMRALAKPARRKLMIQPATDWQVYTSVVGCNPGRRISKDNEAVGILGIVADYDMKTDLETVEKWINQMDLLIQPQFIETSLGEKLRLVWVFERRLPVKDNVHAALVLSLFAEKMRLATLLPGYDPSSEKPTQVWTNGGEWREWRKEPMPWSVVFGYAVDAARKIKGHAEVPLPIVEEEVRKRWPGRWQGDFKLDDLGVRFWDQTADCETGCQVKPDGMLCFTGLVGFMSWSAIFGGKWVDEQSALNLGQIAGDTYFDGRSYYQICAGKWCDVSREDVLLDLQARGIEAIKGKGETVSNAHRVLHHIQKANRVAGAAPLIYRPAGAIDVGWQRILNTSTLKPLEPAARPCKPDDFPFFWHFINGLFVPRPAMYPLQTYLAWWRRGYISLREHSPMMGQAIFLCGPTSSGKTLLCAHALAPTLGGPMPNPYRYLVGETDFTDELFGAALWCINDEESPNDAGKHKMQAKIKSATVNPVHTYHPKFCKKLSIEWQGRLAITGNADHQSVGMLPEVTDGTRDKLMFFATQPYVGVWPSRKETEAIIAKELPYFARYLLDWEPPVEVLDNSRMGVRSYFDPVILELSQQQAFSYNLKELLGRWTREAPEWDGKETLRETATGVVASCSTLTPLIPLMKEWTVAKIATSLGALARMVNSGVTLVEVSGQRLFEFNKQLLNP